MYIIFLGGGGGAIKICIYVPGLFFFELATAPPRGNVALPLGCVYECVQQTLTF